MSWGDAVEQLALGAAGNALVYGAWHLAKEFRGRPMVPRERSAPGLPVGTVVACYTGPSNPSGEEFRIRYHHGTPMLVVPVVGTVGPFTRLPQPGDSFQHVRSDAVRLVPGGRS